eukprot:6209497-Pleurochrysis_carterae.AAC.3
MVSANNIMFDKRVVRGNTYAAQILPAVLILSVYGALGDLSFAHAPSSHRQRRQSNWSSSATRQRTLAAAQNASSLHSDRRTLTLLRGASTSMCRLNNTSRS